MPINYPVISSAENFHGFRTVHFYESESIRNGYTVQRIPVTSSVCRDLIALVTSPPNPSPMAFAAVDILTPTEDDCVDTFSVRNDAIVEGLKKHGYFQVMAAAIELENTPEPESIPDPVEDLSDEPSQLSLFDL